MRLSIVGGGYVGLVSGACFADQGINVVIIERNQERVDTIQAGRSPFFEPGLDDILTRTIGKTLSATTQFDRAVMETDVTMIAVGTPSRDGGDVDLTAIEAVSDQIGDVLARKAGKHVVIVKSTVPPGTTDTVVAPRLAQRSGKQRGVDLGIGMNPEFLTEGTAVEDFTQPDRIVLGASDPLALDVQQRLYAPFEGTPIVSTGNATAEMIKYMSNALLATLISFSNEFANLCEAVGDVDVAEVQRGVHLSRYLTHGSPAQTAPIASFIEAGCGFGGSCLPKDVKGLLALGKHLGQPTPILDAVLTVNRQRAPRVVEQTRAALSRRAGNRVTVLGVAFRPDTNDTRETPAVPIVDGLLEAGFEVTVFDPQVSAVTMPALFAAAVRVADSLEEAVENAEAVVLVTKWQEFDAVPQLLAQRVDPPVLVDGRRMFDRRAFSLYEGVGLRLLDDSESGRQS